VKLKAAEGSRALCDLDVAAELGSSASSSNEIEDQTCYSCDQSGGCFEEEMRERKKKGGAAVSALHRI